MQAALKLRKVNIYAYGKMNFVNTVLSKRKLNWFVEQGLVVSPPAYTVSSSSFTLAV